MATRTPAWALALVERIEALESAPAKSAPARGKGKSKTRTFASREDRAKGKGFACTVEPSCSRADLRTSARTASHDLETGHTAR